LGETDPAWHLGMANLLVFPLSGEQLIMWNCFAADHFHRQPLDWIEYLRSFSHTAPVSFNLQI
jgi:hypothetical protein